MGLRQNQSKEFKVSSNARAKTRQSQIAEHTYLSEHKEVQVPREHKQDETKLTKTKSQT